MAWRDFLPVHPAAELFDRLSPDELKELGADIKAHELQHAIVLWRDADGEYSLLDGRNRLDAMEVAKLKVAKSIESMLATMNVTIRETPIDPYDFVISANLRRRHLTGEQKRDLIAKLIGLRPDTSDRQIARQAGASPSTVGDVRSNLEEAGQLSKMDSRIGADGKSRKLPPPKPQPQPQTFASGEPEQPAPEHSEPVTAADSDPSEDVEPPQGSESSLWDRKPDYVIGGGPLTIEQLPEERPPGTRRIRLTVRTETERFDVPHVRGPTTTISLGGPYYPRPPAETEAQPAPEPIAESVGKPNGNGTHRVSPKPLRAEAMTTWSRLLDFERDGLLDIDPRDISAVMTEVEADDVREVAPRIIDWIQKIGAALGRNS